MQERLKLTAKPLQLNSKYKKAYVNRAFDKLIIGDAIGAVADLTEAIGLVQN